MLFQYRAQLQAHRIVCKANLNAMGNTNQVLMLLSEEWRPAVPIAQVRAETDTLL